MHKHHKIPKSRGGTDDEWNLVELDPYTHAYEHALDFVLFEHAPWFDCRHEAWPYLPKDLQEAVKKEMSRRMTERQLGQIRSDKVRKAISTGMMGHEVSPLRRFRISEALSGYKQTEQHKQTVSKSLKGKPKPQVQCPHCGKQGGAPTMKRWHFDNCKHKPN